MSKAVEGYLTIKEVASALAVSPRSVWKWISAGKVPGIQRVGRRGTPIVPKEFVERK